MAPGLSKDIQYHAWSYSLLQGNHIPNWDQSDGCMRQCKPCYNIQPISRLIYCMPIQVPGSLSLPTSHPTPQQPCQTLSMVNRRSLPCYQPAKDNRKVVNWKISTTDTEWGVRKNAHPSNKSDRYCCNKQEFQCCKPTQLSSAGKR